MNAQWILLIQGTLDGYPVSETYGPFPSPVEAQDLLVAISPRLATETQTQILNLLDPTVESVEIMGWLA